MMHVYIHEKRSPRCVHVYVKKQKQKKQKKQKEQMWWLSFSCVFFLDKLAFP